MTGLRPGYPRFCLGEAGARSCFCRPYQPTRRVLRIVLQCDGRVVTIHHQKVDLRIGFFGNRLEVQFPGSETLQRTRNLRRRIASKTAHIFCPWLQTTDRRPICPELFRSETPPHGAGIGPSLEKHPVGASQGLSMPKWVLDAENTAPLAFCALTNKLWAAAYECPCCHRQAASHEGYRRASKAYRPDCATGSYVRKHA